MRQSVSRRTCTGRRARAGTMVAMALVVGACASAGAGTPTNEEPVPGASVAEYTNIYLALEDLRPTWVRRAREVYVDSNYAGSVQFLRQSFNERIRGIELVPSRDVVRRFGPCQAPAGTGTVQRRDPQCGTRPVIHVVLYGGQ